MCGLPQVASCNTRPDCVASPVPAQPFTRLCIHKDGDVPCPSADYADKFVAFKSIDDKRTCTACGTPTPTGGACGTAWGVSGSDLACATQAAPSDKTIGTCYSYPGIGTHVNIGAAAPSAGTCTPTGGQATETATLTAPVTFCCNR